MPNVEMNSKDKIIKVGILTISDTRTSTSSNVETFDSSGHNLKILINKYNVIKSAKVVEYDCVIDDVEKIQAKMIEWCSGQKVDVLLSTGGTGFGPRDVTPEATLALIQKLTPGISQAILNESMKITPMAMLSRAVSGIYQKTLIINLPGSKKAAKECLRVVAYVIPHAVSIIKNENEISTKFHNQLNSQVNIQSYIPECISKVACRFRESPFPKISVDSALKILKDNSFLQYTENNKIMYPAVCIFSTGDELESSKDKFKGYIKDTNSLMIQQILEKDNYEGKIFNLGVVRDNWDDLCKQFEESFNIADIVVTSGGVSMGEKDFIKYVLKEHFKSHIHFGRVDMKPGMPTTFATLYFKGKKKYVFCLPGNPVSAGVCTHLFVLPYLRIVSHKKSIVYSFKAKLTHSINELDARPEYKRALLKYENGDFYVSCLTSYQQSSRLLSFVDSNCLLELPSSTKVTSIKADTIMNVILIKSIKNTYSASVLNEMNLEMKVCQNPDVIFNEINACIPPQTYSSINNVLDLMIENVFILKTKVIPTNLALGYVLQSPVYSSENLPPFPASIKDGYAIKYINENSWSQGPSIFKVVQVSVAGTVPDHQNEINLGECARISTGAPLPPGANCVVQVEDTSVESKSSDETIELEIAVLKQPKPFDNIRNIGSDISIGQRLLDQDTELGPFEIALLRSVSCEEVCVYQHQVLHIIPFSTGFMCSISKTLKNLMRLDNFKGSIFTHSLCENLEDFSEQCKYAFENADIVVVCSDNVSVKFPLDNFCNVKNYLQVNDNDRKISIGFGILSFKERRVVLFHVSCCDSDAIYNSAHLFILPFLRFATGRKEIISSIKAKTNTSIDLSKAKFEKARLGSEGGNFNTTCFTLDRQNCLVSLPSSSKEMNKLNVGAELDVIITENSDSYFIQY